MSRHIAEDGETAFYALLGHVEAHCRVVDKNDNGRNNDGLFEDYHNDIRVSQ